MADNHEIPKDGKGKPYFSVSPDGWSGKWHKGETTEASNEMMFDAGEWVFRYEIKDRDPTTPNNDMTTTGLEPVGEKTK